MSGSHNAPPPHVIDNYGNEATCYDLAAPDALHPLSDIAALRLELQRVSDALDYQTRRADAMAAELAAHRATLQRLADWAQVVELRRGVTP